MSSKRTLSWAGVVLLAIIVLPGCYSLPGTGPGLSFGLPIPVPMSPYFQQELENKFIEKERYERVPILGPITGGAPPAALDPPSEDQIMRALDKARTVSGGLPFLHEVQRNNVRIVVEPIADYVDPPRFYPLVGPAQLHHAHYKCTIYYSETTRVGWPIPYTTTDEDTREVIYIDKNHLHMVGNLECGPTSVY
jgi:hypothetical protein